MKIRSGFVSNSSSSSFVVKSDITTSDLALIMMNVIIEDRRKWWASDGDIEEMGVSFLESCEAPAASQVTSQKVLRTQSGKPVQVKAWVPGAKKMRL